MLADSFLADRNVVPGLVQRKAEPHAMSVAPKSSAV
jgi:hypothetical protein